MAKTATERFAGSIAELRRSKYLTQQEIANHVGVTVKTYHNWENGKAKPYARHFRKLAEAFSMTLEDLENWTA